MDNNNYDYNGGNQPDYGSMSTAEYMNYMAQQACRQNERQTYENTGCYEPEKTVSGKVSGKKTGHGGIFRKGAAIVAGAALFGVVAGGTFRLVAGDTLSKTSGGQEASVEDIIDDSVDEIAEKEGTVTEDSGDGTVIPTTSVEDDGELDGQRLDVADIAEGVMPSVVSITIKSVEEIPNFFGYVEQYEAEGSGSGIIIGKNDTELLMVTNNHVVSGADTVSVSFIDGEIYEAKVKGTDSDSDLAIIVVALDDLSADTLSQIKLAKLGSSDDLKVGEQVVAIGNALGYGQSVTTGIISAKDRNNSTNTTPLIQTDAAINPGNSGGALLNMQGEVIGINSSKYASTDVEGMGYAIPISEVESILNSLMNRETREKVSEERRGYIGISCTDISSDVSELYGIPEGVLIKDVYEDSGAEKAGLKKNYIITRFDGQSVSSSSELSALLEYYAAGEKIEVTYMVLEDDEYVEKTTVVILGKQTGN